MPRSIVNRALDMLGLGFDDYDHAPQAVAASTPEDEGVYPIRTERHATPASSSVLVRAEPRNMEEATAVADEIKRKLPVILNLEHCSPEEARRIRDFLGGVTYGLNGYMRRIGTLVYACSPFDMPIEKLVLDGANTGQPRYERDEPQDEEEY